MEYDDKFTVRYRMNAYSTPYRAYDCWKANTKVDARVIVYFPCSLSTKTHGTAPWGASRLRARCFIKPPSHEF